MIDIRWQSRFERAGLVCQLTTLAIAIVGLIGWLASIPVLTMGVRTIRPTQPWTFLLLIVSALATRAALFRSPPRRGALLALILVVGILAATLTLVSTGQEERLPGWIRLVGSSDRMAGLPAPNQSLLLGSVALSALLVSSERLSVRLWGQFIAVVTLALAGVVLAAFAYGERDLSRFLLGRGEIGLPGAIGSILLGWSVVLSRPQDPLLRPLVSANLGGKLLRWLVPLALLAPVGLISLVRVQAQFDTPGILAMLAISFSVVLLAGLIYASRQVDLFATRGRLAEDQASRATDTLTQVAPVVSDLVDTLHLVSVKRVHRVEIATRHIPALGFLAGDSLTVFPIGNDDIGLVMVDAAGHGAGPALHSLRIRDCLSQSMRLGASPAVAIEELRWLVTTSDTTATAAVVRVDGLTGRVIYALAGHPPPLVDRNGRFEQEQAGGPLLHPQARGEWVDRVVPLDTGNHFVVFTDGVADVFTSSTGHDEFTSLSGYLSHHPPRSGEELADSCIDFSSKRARVDDAAVAVVSLGPP